MEIGVFLLLLEPDLGTAMGNNSTGAQEVSVSTCHTAGFPPSHPVVKLTPCLGDAHSFHQSP